MSEFTRLTEWTPAFDKRDPDPSKNYGIHGMNLRYRAESCEDQAEYIDEGERVCERHSRDAGDGYDVRRISEA